MENINLSIQLKVSHGMQDTPMCTYEIINGLDAYVKSLPIIPCVGDTIYYKHKGILYDLIIYKRHISPDDILLEIMFGEELPNHISWIKGATYLYHDRKEKQLTQEGEH